MAEIKCCQNWIQVAEDRTRLSNFTFTLHFHALEKEMATHSSFLAWRIPGMGEPGGLPSLGSRRVGHDWSDLAAVAVNYTHVGNASSILVWRTSPGKGHGINSSIPFWRTHGQRSLATIHCLQRITHNLTDFACVHACMLIQWWCWTIPDWRCISLLPQK